MANKQPEPWDYALKRLFTQEIAHLTESLVAGTPTDFSAYQYIRGQIDGIQFAINSLFQVRKRLDPDGDEEE